MKSYIENINLGTHLDVDGLKVPTQRQLFLQGDVNMEVLQPSTILKTAPNIRGCCMFGVASLHYM